MVKAGLSSRLLFSSLVVAVLRPSPVGDAAPGPHDNVEEDSCDEDFEELEMGEEEELDNDPVLPDHEFQLDQEFAAANENVEEAAGVLRVRPRPRPHAEIVDVLSDDERMEVDLAGEAGTEVTEASGSREAPPAALPRAVLPAPAPPVSMDVLVSRQQPGRRRDQHHHKSFVFGMFFVKYRDDRSMLYPDKTPAWTVSCPVHDKWNLAKFWSGFLLLHSILHAYSLILRLRLRLI